jgi:hypothetical protein
MLGELSMFTHPSIPDVPQPMFNFNSAATVMCGFYRNSLADLENRDIGRLSRRLAALCSDLLASASERHSGG